MARSTFPVEVLTPEGQAYEGEVEMISTRTATGSIGVLANHAPLMAMLEPTELKLYTSGSENPGSAEIERFAQGEGYLQVVDNSALLIVEDALRPDELDRAALESRLKDAQSALEGAEEGSEEQKRHRREIARAEAFLAIGDGGSG
jgi:F-type H+-transporting ATPase subunit epsilon